MNRLDAMLVVASGEETAKLLAYDDEVRAHRFAAWVGAVWYYGRPLRAEPRAYWGLWWDIRCMLGALGAMPFGGLLLDGADAFCALKGKWDPPYMMFDPAHVMLGLRTLYLARYGAGLPLLPPGGAYWPEGAEPWRVAPALPGVVVAGALAENARRDGPYSHRVRNVECYAKRLRK